VIDSPQKEFCIGVDVGGTKVSSALFDRAGNLLGRNKAPLDRGGGEAAAGQVVGLIRALEATALALKGKVLAAGVCVPGISYQKTGLVWAPNIPGWDQFPLRASIQDRLKMPLLIDSDRSAYVLGEQWCGAARGLKDVVFLAVGTGIGAGILSGGRLVRGHEDIAGAVGWFGLNPAYKKEYAEMGCFEAEASGNSVGRKARQAIQAGALSEMARLAGGSIDRITAETVTAAARDKDPLALKIIEETAAYLAMGVANIVSLLNPEMIVLGGGLFQAGDLLLDPVRREFGRWAQPLAARGVRLELSRLGEDAGLYGAGRLAWQSLKGEEPCLP
jgi:glucokinase